MNALKNYLIFSPGGNVLQISCHEDDTSVQPMFKQGRYEPHVQFMLERLCVNCNNILDIGANYGQHTVLMSKLNPEAKIIAIEASKSNIEVLNVNLKANDVNNVQIINAYLSDANKDIEFFHSTSLAACAFSCTSDYGDTKHPEWKEQVKAKRLDSLIDDTSFDFIKMDIEGAELLALSGGEKIFKDCPFCLIELNTFTSENFYNTSINKLIEKMEQLGFTDGLIFTNGDIQNISIPQIKEIMSNNIMLEVLFWQHKQEKHEN